MNNMSDKAICTWFFILVVGFCGWVANIVKLVGADVFSGMEIARAIGIFVAPLGAVLGFL